MALPTVFGNLTSTSGSLALLDGNFNAVGALVTNIGTVTGTNAYVFTAASNNPTISAYANFMRFGFVAGNTSTNAVTFKYGSLAALKVFGPDGVTQITTGGIVTTVYYELVYNSALDSAVGGFQIVSNQPSNVSLPVSVSNGGTGLASATAYAVLCGGTTSTGAFQSIASVGTSGQVLTSNGATLLPTFQTAAAGGMSFRGFSVYTSTQVVTIPASVTAARIRLVGGGGGAKSTSGTDAGAAGSGGALEKWLTSLTAANTLSLTIGAAGTSTPGNGGNTTLASGTQTITTLTGNGGTKADGNGGRTAAQGGTATNGDINILGGSGMYISDLTDATSGALGGSPGLGFGQGGRSGSSAGGTSANGSGYGSGAAAAGSEGGVAGLAGVCLIEWWG